MQPTLCCPKVSYTYKSTRTLACDAHELPRTATRELVTARSATRPLSGELHLMPGRLLLLRTVSRARPLDPKAHHNLGVCLDALGQKAAALSSFEKAFELQPLMAESGSNAAGLLLQAGDAERACTLCYLVRFLLHDMPPP